MSKTMKKVSALLLALLMIVTFMPMTQETAYAAAKKPKKVKGLKVKVSGNKLKISWKKAKNAKKYVVTIKDTKTKLTATKKTKKRKITIKGQYNTKYQISVKGVNGNKKGKSSKKVTKKTGKDPAVTNSEQKAKDAEQKVKDAQAAEQKAKDELALAEEAKRIAEEIARNAVVDKEAAEAAKAAAEAALAVAEDEKEKAEIAATLAIVTAYLASLAADEATAEKEAAELAATQASALADYYKYKDALEEAQEEYRDEDDMERARLERRTANGNRKIEKSTPGWNREVRKGINAMIKAHRDKHDDSYVVFDFDNTCSIFDVEEQLAVYQLQQMAFASDMTPEKLREVLATGIAQDEDDFPEGLDSVIKKGLGKGTTYNQWINDIVAAYEELLKSDYAIHFDDDDDEYGFFTPEGLDDEDAVTIQFEPAWKEFATKMRAMYDVVFDAESADVAYPWVLYWFTGMTHDEVYDLARASHHYYRAVETTEKTWETEGEDSEVGPWEYTWTSGTNVSQNIVELMTALDASGIDVWICSASAIDPIRAAVDEWGLHDRVTGVMAMTNVYRKGVYVNEYDYLKGYAWCPDGDDWEEADYYAPTEAQTQGKGKVTAVKNVCGPVYGKGPIGGFMDSTGDFNFCSEFEDLEVVCCFNRASRKVTDGGGLVSEVAIYEADTLGYNYEDEDNPAYQKARADGNILYVLQGRDERGMRSLLNITADWEDPYEQFDPDDLDPSMYGRYTIRVSDGVNDPKVLAKSANWEMLDYFARNTEDLTVEDIMNTYCIKTAADDPANKFGFDYGFLTKYAGYMTQDAEGTDAPLLVNKDWNPEVRNALNDMVYAERDKGQYAVFDFDNTCSIFDVEEQLAVYQLQHMAFDETMTPDMLREVLATGIAADPEKFPKGLDTPLKKEWPGTTYNQWIDDIAFAYEQLLKSDYAIHDENDEGDLGHFTPAGLDDDDAEDIQDEDDWQEFATKMRAMYDLVGGNESVAVSYPWVLYWFTGMSHDEVYDLAYDSHEENNDVESRYETWETPDTYTTSKVGFVDVEFTMGVTVSANIRELMKVLSENGIDVWVCSASATDPIRAAIDFWGLHDYVTGMMAMTNVYDEENDQFVNEYDYDNGHAWFPITLYEDDEDGEPWIEGDVATEAQTQGKGKVIAVQNVCYPIYDNHGPIAGFMDSTGDFNFCTEFETLQVVCCFNRANRKVTDGGGLVAEVACYQADALDYDYETAMDAGDTLYVLQGRDEREFRSLRDERTTMRLGEEEAQLFREEKNFRQLAYFSEAKMSTGEIFDKFAFNTAAEEPENPFEFDYGFLDEYDGYHSQA